MLLGGGTVEIGGSVLGCVAWPVVGVSSDRDRGISPLVRVMDVSKHGYGVGEQWLRRLSPQPQTCWTDNDSFITCHQASL